MSLWPFYKAYLNVLFIITRNILRTQRPTNFWKELILWYFSRERIGVLSDPILEETQNHTRIVENKQNRYAERQSIEL